MLNELPLFKSPCPFCGAAGYLSEPCYADEYSTAFCENDCGASTESFPMGEYNEGSVRVIEAWNAGLVYR